MKSTIGLPWFSKVPRWRGGGGLAQRHRRGPEELAADPLRGGRATEMGETRRAQHHRAARLGRWKPNGGVMANQGNVRKLDRARERELYIYIYIYIYIYLFIYIYIYTYIFIICI